MSAVTVWIGGGTGGGKTTVARMFAGRHGLRVFPLDSFWYSHLARRPEPGPDPDEQWLGSSAQAQADEFEALTRRRWPLILDDLSALAPSPPTVVEGPQVLPDLVPPGDAAVFLMPVPRFQRAILEQRPLPPTAEPARALENRIEKDRLFAQRVTELAAARGFPVLPVDGSQSPVALLASVEEVFADLTAVRPARDDVRAARRWENAVIADNVRSWLATPHVPPQLPTSYAFACECGTPPCAEVVHLSLSDYEHAQHVLARGHLVDG